MDAIQALLSQVLLIFAGVALVLLAIILLLVEVNFIIRLARRLQQGWQAEPAMAEPDVGPRPRTPEYATTRPRVPEDTPRPSPDARRLDSRSREEVEPDVHPGARGSPSTKPEQQAVTVFVRAQMDPEILTGYLSAVAVTISRERISRVKQPHDTTGEAYANEAGPIILETIPRLNVEVVGRSKIETAVPRQDEPMLFTFRVRGTHQGDGEVWVLVRQWQKPLVTLVLKFAVVRNLTSTLESSATAEGIATAPKTPPKPLRLLRIIEQRLGETVVFRYDLEAPT